MTINTFIVMSGIIVILMIYCFYLYSEKRMYEESRKKIINLKACKAIHNAGIYKELAKELDIDSYGEEDADPEDFVRQAVLSVWAKADGG